MKKNKTIIIAIVLAILTEVIFFFINRNLTNVNIKNVTTFIIIVVCVFSVIFSKKLFKNNYQHYLFLIISIGLLIRLMYISYTPVSLRQHDFNNATNSGHLSYITTLAETGKLPDSNKGQFYHPPLFHMVESLIYKFSLHIGLNAEEGAEMLQYGTCFISFLTILIIWKLIEKLKINDSLKLLLNLFLTFHPHMILLSGCVNNDVLVVLLEFLILLYLLKWYDEPNLKNTIILALATGLCVMTKLNGAIMAIPILFIFIKKVFFSNEKIQIWKNKTVFHILLFGLISLPIGLWYPIRNWISFHQPLTYVPSPSAILSVQEYNVMERFFTFPLHEIGGILPDPFRDYSVPVYAIKTSIFGDLLSDDINIIEVWLLLVAIILVVIFILALLKLIRKKKKNTTDLLFLISFFTFIISFIYFNLKKPYGCTMDFRYIIPTVFFLIVFLAQYLDTTKHALFKKFIIYTCYLFVLLSVTMFYTL